MDALVKKAIEIREKAYAPYSKFKVGAAVETETMMLFDLVPRAFALNSRLKIDHSIFLNKMIWII